ncbi:hypothetical protein V1512DRAFT_288117 [Lipomyces arxii]|uniref:uncharacterized protein n=1 Tax=Lipomyces arxii TaxID=56418 RepID=UPI0034CDBF4B
MYDDEHGLEMTLEKLEFLLTKLAEAAPGKAFALQHGDCMIQSRIESKLKTVLQIFDFDRRHIYAEMTIIHTDDSGIQLPLLRFGKIAGQFAKSRFKSTEAVDGDNVSKFILSDRRPDLSRLVGAYFHSAATLNFIRSLLAACFPDLHRPFDWSLSHARYTDVVQSIIEGLSLLKTDGLMVKFEQSPTLKLLDLTDGVKKWYNTSLHFVSIGDRTRQIDDAHVRHFGIQNPKSKFRLGASKIASILCLHIEDVTKTKPKAVCSGLKTRDFEGVMSKLSQSLQIHIENGSISNGVHLALSGDAVTEFIGRCEQLTDEDLAIQYDTVCDPRFSESQCKQF